MGILFDDAICEMFTIKFTIETIACCFLMEKLKETFISSIEKK
jgi:hypothetical protein